MASSGGPIFTSTFWSSSRASKRKPVSRLQSASRPPPVMQVTGKIRHAKQIQLEDFKFLRSTIAKGIPKVTIPSPTMLHFRGGRGAISQDAAPALGAVYHDV